jgi:hypothetical protein
MDGRWRNVDGYRSFSNLNAISVPDLRSAQDNDMHGQAPIKERLHFRWIDLPRAGINLDSAQAVSTIFSAGPPCPFPLQEKRIVAAIFEEPDKGQFEAQKHFPSKSMDFQKHQK